jgi:hypothetical protein
MSTSRARQTTARFLRFFNMKCECGKDAAERSTLCPDCLVKVLRLVTEWQRLRINRLWGKSNGER